MLNPNDQRLKGNKEKAEKKEQKEKAKEVRHA
jgi:hypothetical protein